MQQRRQAAHNRHGNVPRQTASLANKRNRLALRHIFAYVEAGNVLPSHFRVRVFAVGVVFGGAMAEDHSPPLLVADIKDPAVLFERHNTEQIRQIERKVREEIEQKKEELRQMVGERYRHLIDVADTIGEMRQCSESVVQSIQDMQQYCVRLKHGKSSAGSSRQEVNGLPNCTCGTVTPVS